MNVKIETKLKQKIEVVWQRFDQKLFEALTPSYLPFKIIRFDGVFKNNEFVLDFHFAQWRGQISERVENENEKWFVDIGLSLPFPLKNWKHKHLLVKQEDLTLLVDDVEYFTRSKILDIILYPIMYLFFYLRKPVYQKYLCKNS